MTQPLLSSANKQTDQNWNFVSDETILYFQKKIKMIRIIATEGYATFRHVLPSAIAWVWRKTVTNEIETFEIKEEGTNHVAYLNMHGKIPSLENRTIRPVLLSHGDYGHPYSMLHLADGAQNQGMPTFSLYIPGVENNDRFENNNHFLKQAIDKIESIVQEKGGTFDGILGAGHSKGAILLAKRYFMDQDPRLKAICSIAGRLNILQENECRCPILTSIIQNIYQAIVNHPEKPLMQIVPQDDWNAPQHAMKVRPNDHGYSVPGMHLSGLFANETKQHFNDFINEFSLI